MRIQFATGNVGKLAEAQAHLEPLGHRVESARVDVLEIQADTLEEVARFKAENLLEQLSPPFFVEDAGLFVDALHGFPGVYSAYAYKTLGDAGLLNLLAHEAANRLAHFQAVIAYVDPHGQLHLFSGRIEGSISNTPQGEGGFGYDPVFIPKGHERTFAQLTPAEKNAISHRGRALKALADHIQAADAKKKR
jgi:XTP/dITP diphosphohydrolase